MKMMLKKSKGFTLVELLIVIIIIGILAGMMMLSTGGATAKAEATKLASDMRNMKAAGIMVYADTYAWPTDVASLDEYLDQDVDSTKYSIVSDCIKLTPPSTMDPKILVNLGVLANKGDLVLYSDETHKYIGSGVGYMPFY